MPSPATRTRLISHTQATSAQLLALARNPGGRLATFDRGLLVLAEPTADRDVLLSHLPTQREGRA